MQGVLLMISILHYLKDAGFRGLGCRGTFDDIDPALP